MPNRKTSRVVIIGAGMSGILAGIKLLAAGFENIVIYEKAEKAGGTWRDNRYPGLYCDTPAHHYTFQFERNPDWSSYLAPGAEILAYFERCIGKYGLDPYIQYDTSIAKAEWKENQWELLTSTGLRDTADIVIAATGVLHHPNKPDIAGAENFEGKLFHSGQWPKKLDLSNKRVGIVGTGSTGVQLVSALSAQAVDVTHFARTPQWIMPVENRPYSDEDRKLFRNDADALTSEMDFENYAHLVDAYTQAIIDKNSEGAAIMINACYDNLENSVHDSALKTALTPDHEPMCKRLVFSPDYYVAIQRENANFVRSDIDAIEKKGIRCNDGSLHELDCIVLATGYQADQFCRPMAVVGEQGVDLEAIWSSSPIAYLSVTVAQMPNWFMLNGPNGPVGNFSLTDIAELQWGYIEQLISKICDSEYSSIAPSLDAMHSYEKRRAEAAKKTVWYTGGCSSWYLNSEGIPASWPWTYSQFVDALNAPAWDDYILSR